MRSRVGHRSYQARLGVFHGFCGLALLVLFAGLAYRQIWQSDQYAEREIVQSQRRILLPAARGDIYDREGRVLVANRPRFSAVVHLSDNRIRREFRRTYLSMIRNLREEGTPFRTREVESEARAAVIQSILDEINHLLGRAEVVDSQVLERHFVQTPLLPFPLINDLELEEFARIVEGIPVDSVIQILNSTMRYYPYGSAAAHTLGYVVSQLDLRDEHLPGGNLTTFSTRGVFGRSGLELSQDTHLQGRTGGEIWVVDPAGYQVERIAFLSPSQGPSLQTTLDIDLQIAAENAIGQRAGAAVALHVPTGDVLVMASRPDYDLNQLTPFISRETFAEIEERGAWLNRAVQGLYPPGSTFKLLTALAGMRMGVLDLQEQIVCRGFMQVGGRRFPCHNRRGHGPLNLVDALRVSCNIYFYDVGLRAGIDNISAEAKRFGLDRRTGVELPFETNNMLVPDRAWKRERTGTAWYPGDTANTAIGQGFLRVTPLQMAVFTASLARWETTTIPTLLYSPRNHAFAPGRAQRTSIGLRDEDREAIFLGMERAVQLGTARMAQVPGVRVGAKTGTAQVRTPEGTLQLAWTLAFAPVNDPTIAIAVVIEGERPDESNAGGTVAAPVVRAILRTYFDKNPLPEVPPTSIVAR